MTALVLVASFAFGWFLWTIGEYHLHRFAMHHLRGRGIASREHLLHHADPAHTDVAKRLLSYLGVLVVGTAIGAIATVVASSAVGVATGAGWVVGYFFYEMLHWRAHFRVPRNRYELWLRRHHFHHHFGHPMSNHGVTTSLWDRVYRTFERPERVRVPRRMAMSWLLDDDGQVRPEHRGDYVLAGNGGPAATESGSGPARDRAAEDRAAEDRDRAFANQAPLA